MAPCICMAGYPAFLITWHLAAISGIRPEIIDKWSQILLQYCSNIVTKISTTSNLLTRSWMYRYLGLRHSIQNRLHLKKVKYNILEVVGCQVHISVSAGEHMLLVLNTWANMCMVGSSCLRISLFPSTVDDPSFHDVYLLCKRSNFILVNKMHGILK